MPDSLPSYTSFFSKTLHLKTWDRKRTLEQTRIFLYSSRIVLESHFHVYSRRRKLLSKIPTLLQAKSHDKWLWVIIISSFMHLIRSGVEPWSMWIQTSKSTFIYEEKINENENGSSNIKLHIIYGLIQPNLHSILVNSFNPSKPIELCPKSKGYIKVKLNPKRGQHKLSWFHLKLTILSTQILRHIRHPYTQVFMSEYT